MIFLQPALLWGLPAVLLPLCVHLLNRLRYRSVRWAAIMFLITATRSSTRRARLRYYLIMVCRMLIILCIILALSRPLVGGWLGATIGGEPDLVIILLDRSMSMETLIQDRQTSKRAHALALLAQASRFSSPTTRFVLIESTLRVPLEIADLAALDEMALTKPSDTAADIPAMFRAALDYILKNRPGSTEIWVVSDLQESNWHLESGEWQRLHAQLAALPQELRVFILDLSGEEGNNLSVAIRNLTYRKLSGGMQLNLVIDLHATQPPREPFPMTLTINAVRSQVEIDMNSQDFRYQGEFKVASQKHPRGWGKIEIPADDNSRDNICYFTYSEDKTLHAAIVADDSLCAGILQAAVAPDPRRFNRSCESVERTELDRIGWADLDLLIWQAGAPDEATENAVRTFVAGGGVLLCFPPAKADTKGFFGMNWGNIENADEKKPFRISIWDDQDGPLARTDSGVNLPLAQLAVKRRQSFSPVYSAEKKEGQDRPVAPTWVKLAAFSDRKPFFQACRIGNGFVFVCATLPRKEWSTLEEGTVLVPVVQRVLQLGGARRKQTRLAECGEWRPAFEQEIWQSIGVSSNSDYRCHAGIYEYSGQYVALNCPSAELLPGFLEAQKIKQLLGDLRVEIFTGALAKQHDQLQNEIWPLLVYAALVCMLLETVLVSSPRLFMQRTGQMPAGIKT